MSVQTIPAAADSGLSRRILGNMSALMVAQILYRAVSLVLSVVLTRYLGVTEQGLYGLSLNVIAMFSAFADLGISTLVIRDMNQDRGTASGLVSTYFGTLLVANLLLSAAAILAAFIIGYETRVIATIALLAIGMLFTGTASAFHAALIGKERMKRVASLEAVVTVVIAAGMLSVIALGGGIISLGIVSAVSGLTRFMIFGRNALRLFPELRFVFDAARTRKMLTRGLPFTLNVGLYVILTKIDVLLLESRVSPESLGLYSAATRLTFPLTMLSMMTATAVFPVLSRTIRESSDTAFAIVRRAMRWLGLIGLGIAIVITLTSPSIVLLAYGPAFAPVSDLLRILIWYIPIFYFYQVVGDLLVAADKVWAVVRVSAAILVVNIVANLLLIPVYGATGSAMTLVGCEFLRCAGLLVTARRTLSF